MGLTIESRVKKVIAKKLEKDPESLGIANRFSEDLSMDSLLRVEVMMLLEEEFKELKLEIPDAAAESMKTIGDIITYIESTAAKDGIAAK